MKVSKLSVRNQKPNVYYKSCGNGKVSTAWIDNNARNIAFEIGFSLFHVTQGISTNNSQSTPHPFDQSWK